MYSPVTWQSRDVEVSIRFAEPEHDDAVGEFLRRHNHARVTRLGQLLMPLEHPAVLAERDGNIVGVLTLRFDDAESEVLTLHVDGRQGGIGTALLEEAARLARDRGSRRLFLVTTNDNVDALRFYQRRGFRLCALHVGAVDESRATLKPEIPAIGEYGIPLRDELVLELALTPFNAG
jgi:ribosomal protein S18 acetylase RimI-like enzyme